MPYHSIEDPAKLRRVLEATLLLEADLDLPSLLRHIVEEACSMTNARYGALGVLNNEGTALSEFITVGLDPDQEERIGSRPTGRGVLGTLIIDPRALRVTELGSHTESYGFPANHPPMTSFLGVPIKVRDDVYGNLYLTDKVGWKEFTRDDEALIEALALAAGIAIENARLHQRVQEVAIYEERDRLARDLHDTVIQRLFAIGLSLQSMASNPSAAADADRLTSTIADIDDTIRQVRTSIFELGTDRIGRGLRDDVVSLLADLQPVVGFGVRASFDGPVDTAVPDVVREHVLAVIREAVSNIGRHAKASAATVAIRVADGSCRLQVIDDGQGMSGSEPAGGLGLGNMGRRAEKLHGEFLIEDAPTGGTILTWQVPILQ
ncbi:MAG: GAF domain-containing sensor histidine kinase [Acidimicrobiales bacterium]|jgi:signal transduction histidine kinase